MSNINLGDRIEARFLFDEFKKKFMSGKNRSMKLKNLQKVRLYTSFIYFL